MLVSAVPFYHDHNNYNHHHNNNDLNYNYHHNNNNNNLDHRINLDPSCNLKGDTDQFGNR